MAAAYGVLLMAAERRGVPGLGPGGGPMTGAAGSVMQSSSLKQLWVLMAIVFVDMIGFLMVRRSCRSTPAAAARGRAGRR